MYNLSYKNKFFFCRWMKTHFHMKGMGINPRFDNEAGSREEGGGVTMESRSVPVLFGMCNIQSNLY